MFEKELMIFKEQLIQYHVLGSSYSGSYFDLHNPKIWLAEFLGINPDDVDEVETLAMMTKDMLDKLNKNYDDEKKKLEDRMHLLEQERIKTVRDLEELHRKQLNALKSTPTTVVQTVSEEEIKERARSEFASVQQAVEARHREEVNLLNSRLEEMKKMMNTELEKQKESITQSSKADEQKQSELARLQAELREVKRQNTIFEAEINAKNADERSRRMSEQQTKQGAEEELQKLRIQLAVQEEQNKQLQKSVQLLTEDNKQMQVVIHNIPPQTEVDSVRNRSFGVSDKPARFDAVSPVRHASSEDVDGNEEKSEGSSRDKDGHEQSNNRQRPITREQVQEIQSDLSTAIQETATQMNEQQRAKAEKNAKSWEILVRGILHKHTKRNILEMKAQLSRKPKHVTVVKMDGFLTRMEEQQRNRMERLRALRSKNEQDQKMRLQKVLESMHLIVEPASKLAEIDFDQMLVERMNERARQKMSMTDRHTSRMSPEDELRFVQVSDRAFIDRSSASGGAYAQSNQSQLSSETDRLEGSLSRRRQKSENPSIGGVELRERMYSYRTTKFLAEQTTSRSSSSNHNDDPDKPPNTPEPSTATAQSRPHSQNDIVLTLPNGFLRGSPAKTARTTSPHLHSPTVRSPSTPRQAHPTPQKPTDNTAHLLILPTLDLESTFPHQPSYTKKGAIPQNIAVPMNERETIRLREKKLDAAINPEEGMKGITSPLTDRQRYERSPIPDASVTGWITDRRKSRTQQQEAQSPLPLGQIQLRNVKVMNRSRTSAPKEDIPNEVEATHNTPVHHPTHNPNGTDFGLEKFDLKSHSPPLSMPETSQGLTERVKKIERERVQRGEAQDWTSPERKERVVLPKLNLDAVTALSNSPKQSKYRRGQPEERRASSVNGLYGDRSGRSLHSPIPSREMNSERKQKPGTSGDGIFDQITPVVPMNEVRQAKFMELMKRLNKTENEDTLLEKEYEQAVSYKASSSRTRKTGYYSNIAFEPVIVGTPISTESVPFG
ncbi:hypothetical protein BLNAU_4547 [Blattamonas nauphoetae]|uniref:Uncharacterized protein n=1 Tax=Blattamonas nauphoetae TaxID=2049346 RepID=A0ABQ9Y9C9_9EUKA|nr:hypothetical protein BLNAU_4547 [Blattamonas nauphoetae]